MLACFDDDTFNRPIQLCDVLHKNAVNRLRSDFFPTLLSRAFLLPFFSIGQYSSLFYPRSSRITIERRPNERFAVYVFMRYALYVPGIRSIANNDVKRLYHPIQPRENAKIAMSNLRYSTPIPLNGVSRFDRKKTHNKRKQR